MRTTLDIDGDVLHVAKELAARDGTTAGRILSALARLGLVAQSAAKRSTKTRGGVPLLPSRGEVVTLEHVTQLTDDEGT